MMVYRVYAHGYKFFLISSTLNTVCHRLLPSRRERLIYTPLPYCHGRLVYSQLVHTFTILAITLYAMVHC